MAKQLRCDQGGRNRRTRRQRTPGRSVASACVWREQLVFSALVSPVISTVESVGATFTTLESTLCRAGDAPTISFKHERLIDLLSQRKVFVTHPRRSLTPIPSLAEQDQRTCPWLSRRGL